MPIHLGKKNKREKQFTSDIIRDFEKLKGNRVVWDRHYDEIAELVSPVDFVFQVTHHPGEKRTNNVYDNTAILGAQRYAAFMDSIQTPRNQKWHGLQSSNPELNKEKSVKEFYDELRDVMFRQRYKPRANFSSQMFEIWRGLGMFGTAGMIINDFPGFGTQYKTIHLSQLYIVENFTGLIDTVYVSMKMTGRQALNRFGKKNVPKKILDSIEKDVWEEHEFVHFIHPNGNYDPERVGPEFMKYESLIIAVDEKMVVHEGGFNSFPLPVARADTSTDETYGRSAAMMVLPAIKMLNQMKKSDIRMTHRTVDPTLLMQDDGAVKAIDLRPGRIITGGLDRNGRPTIVPLDNKARLDINEAKMQMERDDINRAFLVDLYLMQIDREMTATEVLHRAKEQSTILSSFTGRQESEFLGPLIEREMEILELSGNMPEMPPVMMESEGEWETTYTNPISQAQKADEALGSQNMMSILFEASNFMPEILDNVNPDIFAKSLHEASGAKEMLLNSDDTVQQIRGERAKAMQEQQQVDNLGAESGAQLNQAKVMEMAANQ